MQNETEEINNGSVTFFDSCRIRRIRRYARLTQLDFAVVCGVSKETVFNWEKGVCSPSFLATVRLYEMEKRYVRYNEKGE
jgi:DNA-binding transcriptional regulator YiaG